MANFDPIVQWVLYQEDSHKHPGMILNEGDGVGFTRLGITQKYHGSDVPAEFFSTMSFADAVVWAKMVYKKSFWDLILGDEIPFDVVAAPIMSFAVNDSPGMAVRTLQTVLQVNVDGILGPKTLAELNSKDPNIIAKLYRAEWENFYHRDVSINPSKAQFLDGWIARVYFPYPSYLVPAGLYI